MFNRPGGVVPTGFAFTLTNANSSGPVMVTADSADPRNVDGTVYTNARADRDLLNTVIEFAFPWIRKQRANFQYVLKW